MYLYVYKYIRGVKSLFIILYNYFWIVLRVKLPNRTTVIFRYRIPYIYCNIVVLNISVFPILTTEICIFRIVRMYIILHDAYEILPIT